MTATRTAFRVGMRVIHKHHREEIGTVERGGLHTNRSPWFVVRWDSGGSSRVWAVDLLPVPTKETAST